MICPSGTIKSIVYQRKVNLMSANIDVFAPQKVSELRRTPLSELSQVHMRVTQLEEDMAQLKAQMFLILELERPQEKS
jgi:hypothetical protein